MQSEYVANGQSGTVEIRDARVEDIEGIVKLMGTCGPYLTKHGPYLYLIYTRCFSDTCCVAIQSGTIIGWCSMLPVAKGSYFLHQLGIAPEARGRSLAVNLFAYLLSKLCARHGDDFRLEFTVDRRNKRVQRLNQKVARRFGLCLQKLPETLPSLEDGCDEELYEMTPARELDANTISVAA